MQYLILVVMLLIPAWGWAEELTSTTFEMTIWTDHSTGPIATCDLKYTNCVIIRPASFPCYERMREAMQAMHKKFDRETPVYLGDSMQMTFDIEQNERTLKLWQQTMKDCVEGR